MMSFNQKENSVTLANPSQQDIGDYVWREEDSGGYQIQTRDTFPQLLWYQYSANQLFIYTNGLMEEY